MMHMQHYFRSTFASIIGVILVTACTVTAPSVKPMTDYNKKVFENINQTVVVRYKSVKPSISWGLTGSYVVEWPEDLQQEYIKKDKKPTIKFLLKRHGITDPLETLAKYFVTELKTRTVLSNFMMVEQAMDYPVKDNYAHYKAKYKQAYVLEIQQQAGAASWGFAAEVLSTSSYNLNFWSYARLIRQSDATEIWRGQCAAFGTMDDRLVVSFDELVSKNNPKLKKVFANAIRKCAKILVNQYFGSREVY